MIDFPKTSILCNRAAARLPCCVGLGVSFVGEAVGKLKDGGLILLNSHFPASVNSSYT